MQGIRVSCLVFLHVEKNGLEMLTFWGKMILIGQVFAVGSPGCVQGSVRYGARIHRFSYSSSNFYMATVRGLSRRGCQTLSFITITVQ